MKLLWCVSYWTDKTRKVVGTCATKDDAKPSADAFSDETACGHSVVLRIGSRRGKPT